MFAINHYKTLNIISNHLHTRTNSKKMDLCKQKLSWNGRAALTEDEIRENTIRAGLEMYIP